MSLESAAVPGRWAPYFLSVLRIAAAVMFLTHGAQKLFGMPAATPRQPVELLSLMGVAGVLETCGGLLLLLGLFTRPAALVLVVEMVSAYAMAHLPRGAWPLLNGGEVAVLYGVTWLYIAVAGPGPWSVDAVRRRSGRSDRRTEARLAA